MLGTSTGDSAGALSPHLAIEPLAMPASQGLALAGTVYHIFIDLAVMCGEFPGDTDIGAVVIRLILDDRRTRGSYGQQHHDEHKEHIHLLVDYSCLVTASPRALLVQRGMTAQGMRVLIQINLRLG